jgi:hypothetical protein
MATAVLALSALAAPVLSAGELALVDFKGSDPSTTFDWRAQNDPVMGGQSYSSVSVASGMLNFTGACKIVPSLNAPGFITAVAGKQREGDNALDGDHAWNDVSSCKGLKITAKSMNEYAGFRISFGNAHPILGKFFAYGYKSHFSPTVGSTGPTYVPFANFTDFWDDATGKPIHTCHDEPKYCPDSKTLANMKTMSIWAEGVEGDVQLFVESVSGYECGA